MYTTLCKDYLLTPSPPHGNSNVPKTFRFPPDILLGKQHAIKKCRGVKYWMKKLFWVVSFLGSLFTALWMISKMWIYNRANPIVTIFNPMDVPIGILPFPAITICNINNVQQTKMDQYIKRGLKPNLTNDELKSAYSDLYNINHICRSSRTFTERVAEEYNHFTLDEKLKAEMVKRKLEVETKDPTRLLREASQSCKEMILYCLWMDEIQNCTSLFREIETDFGYCCTFNLLPLSLLLNNSNRREAEQEIRLWQEANLDSDNILLKTSRIPQSNINSNSKRRYPHRQIYAGKSSGLSLLLFADLDEYNCTSSDSEGFLVSLNLPLDFPRMRESSIAIPSGSEVFMSIRPELTIPDDSINSLPLEKRKCYFGDEYKLKYYTHYTTSNCIDECIADWTMHECECVQFYMPSSTNETMCPPRKYSCTENVRKTLIQRGNKEKCSHCLPTCTDLEYSAETTFLRIKAAAMKNLMIEHDYRWNKTLNVADMSIVHMYFGVDSTYPRQRKELYGMLELLSNAGGLLSLFVGFSVMKLLKFLYELTVGLACANKKKNTRDKQQKHETLLVSSSPGLTTFGYNGNVILPQKRFLKNNSNDKSIGKVFLGNVNNPLFISQGRTNEEEVTNAMMTHRYPCGTVTTVHIG